MAAPVEVVVVEDFEPTRRLLERTLESAGYSVESFSSGHEALQRCAARPPQLVVSDLIMPKVDGVSLTRILRTMHDTANIPVIIATAADGPEQAEAVHRAGAQAIVAKPYRRETLLATVRQVLAAARPKTAS